MNVRPAKEVLTRHQGGSKCTTPPPLVFLTYDVDHSSVEKDAFLNPRVRSLHMKFVSHFPLAARCTVNDDNGPCGMAEGYKGLSLEHCRIFI